MATSAIAVERPPPQQRDLSVSVTHVPETIDLDTWASAYVDALLAAPRDPQPTVPPPL